MAITIPDRTQIRMTTDFAQPNNGHALPNMLADTAMTNPQPVAVSLSGATADPYDQAQCTPASGSGGNAAGYVGFCPESNVGSGSPCSPVRNVIVDGYAGVTPGAAVYIDTASAADDAATKSGLTHTQPSTSSTTTITDDLRAGDTSATATILLVVPAGVTTLAGLDLSVAADAAASDTNYWTFALVNKGNDGSGTTAMLAASDLNTTKSTGGNGGFTAFVKNAATLHGTAGNLAVTPGQVLALTATKTSSAPALTGLTIRATYTGAVSGGAKDIGVGWSTTKILFK